MRPTTFETTYPQLPFAPLVGLALALGRLLARKRDPRQLPDAAPVHA